MINQCRLIYPYFDNLEMLRLQVANWDRFEGELRDAVRIIVIDDHSKQDPVPVLEACKAPVMCFRVDVRWPWNQHQCRNIGAKVAGKDDMWLFMSDIDIMLTPEMAFSMLTRELDPGHHYTMERTFYPDFNVRKRHPNTFLVKRGAYWQVNGYDLDLIPVGGGGYGGDTQFTKQLGAIVPAAHMGDVVLVGYGRRSREGTPAIVGADTTSLDRAEWHARYVSALRKKKEAGDLRSKNPIRTSYKRTL